jgi:GNAT superfamily N-acetyltransferase
MLDPASYSAAESLRDGTPFEIRGLKPDDRAGLLSALSRTSTQSLFRRFFAVRRNFTESEIDRFINVDFVDHVALVAVVQENSGAAIAGGGRTILVRPGEAEMAFAVIDPYQGRGIGSALLMHLIAIARTAGLRKLTADVLPENAAMLKVFERSGFRLHRTRGVEVVQVELELEAGGPPPAATPQ